MVPRRLPEPPAFIIHEALPGDVESGVWVFRCRCHLAFVSDREAVASSRLDHHVAVMLAATA